VFAVDGQESDAVGLHLAQHQRTGGHHHFLVREGDVPPRANGRQGGAQADRADEARNDEIRVVHRHRVEPCRPHLDRDVASLVTEPAAQLFRSGGLGHGDEVGAKASDLIRELVDVASRGERHRPVAIWKFLDDRQRLFSDAARRTQNGEALHPLSSRTWAPVMP